MKYVDFKEHFNNYIVFSLDDIRKIEPKFYRQRLIDWQKKGYVKKIIRGCYVFSDQSLSEDVLFLMADKIYDPSYVSFESAFSHYNLIPEGVYAITSASSKKTQTFKTEFGGFIYHQLKPALMFGYRLVRYNNHRYKMADPEKALLDFFYINGHIATKDDFEQLRFNRQNFLEQVSSVKIRAYLILFKEKKLEQRVWELIKYIKHA